MLEWLPVESKRILAAAYDADHEIIFVEFPEGVRWWYSGCGPEVWEEFLLPTTSQGRYIKDVLDHHPNGRYDG